MLLAAIGKYLDKIRELEQDDTLFHHARESLLAYAEWMAESEYPYLDKPEILEYPNETWAAQDLRKSVVFYQAARYADSQEQAALLLHQAKRFYHYAANELPDHAGSRFTRPVALMLQNGWVGERLHGEVVPLSLETKARGRMGNPVEFLSAWSIVKRVAWDLGRVLPRTSLGRERAWLRARLPKPGSSRG